MKKIVYYVKGKKYFSREEFSELVKNGHYDHVMEHNKMYSDCPITQPLSYDEGHMPWIFIDRNFSNVEDAFFYARKILNEGISGSKVIIEKVEKKLLCKKSKRTILRELLNEHGVVFEWTQKLTVNYHMVISSSEISSSEIPPFEKSSHHGTELEYKKYLEELQPVFEICKMKSGVPHREDVPFLSDFEWNHFYSSFVDAGDCINVKKLPDNTFAITSNGAHRMYVAKKYGLQLLVHVSDEYYL